MSPWGDGRGCRSPVQVSKGCSPLRERNRGREGALLPICWGAERKQGGVAEDGDRLQSVYVTGWWEGSTFGNSGGRWEELLFTKVFIISVIVIIWIQYVKIFTKFSRYQRYLLLKMLFNTVSLSLLRHLADGFIMSINSPVYGEKRCHLKISNSMLL